MLMMRSLALPKVMFGYSGVEGNGRASAVGWLLTGLEFDKYGGESWKSMVATVDHAMSPVVSWDLLVAIWGRRACPLVNLDMVRLD